MNSYLRADARFTAFRPLLHCILLKNTKLQSKHSVIEWFFPDLVDLNFIQ